jgi:hypothetical protein
LIDFIGELDAVHLTDEVPDSLQQIVGLIFARFRTCAEEVLQGIPSLEVETIHLDDLERLDSVSAVMCRDLLGHAGIIRGRNE